MESVGLIKRNRESTKPKKAADTGLRVASPNNFNYDDSTPIGYANGTDDAKPGWAITDEEGVQAEEIGRPVQRA